MCNVCIYHDIYLDVEPKRKMLYEAQEKLAAANKKLETKRNDIKAKLKREQEGVRKNAQIVGTRRRAQLCH